MLLIESGRATTLHDSNRSMHPCQWPKLRVVLMPDGEGYFFPYVLGPPTTEFGAMQAGGLGWWFRMFKIGQILPMSAGQGCAAARRGNWEGEFVEANYPSGPENKGLSVDMLWKATQVLSPALITSHGSWLLCTPEGRCTLAVFSGLCCYQILTGVGGGLTMRTFTGWMERYWRWYTPLLSWEWWVYVKSKTHYCHNPDSIELKF